MRSKFATAKEESGPFSLVKHEPAIEITHKLEAYEKAKKAERQNDSKPSAQDMLNILQPPREWKTPQQQYYMQYVSHSRPGRQDVENVTKSIDKKLLQMQARTEGICPIREYLFAQLFDEVIRQVAIDAPERGLMISRVRDERKMTIAAHETLFREAVNYGHQKQAECEEGMEELRDQVSELEQRKKDLQAKILQLRSKKESMGMRIRERKVIETEKRDYELDALRKQNECLQAFLSRKRAMMKPEEEEEQEQEGGEQQENK